MTRVLRTPLLLAAASFLGASLVLATPAGAIGVTVTPTSGLSDGDQLTLEVTGLVGAYAAWCQLPAGDPNPVGSCISRGFTLGAADPSGTATGTVTARRYLPDPAGDIDCGAAPGTCVVAVADIADTSIGTFVPLAFAVPDPPDTPGSITTTDPFGQPDPGSITVTATGFRPLTEVRVRLCPAVPAPTEPADCNRYGVGGGIPAATTNASGSATIGAAAPWTIDTPGGTVDCRALGACVVAAYEANDFAGTVATAPYRTGGDGPYLYGSTASLLERDEGQDATALVELRLSATLLEEATFRYATTQTPGGNPLLPPATPGVDFPVVDGEVTLPAGTRTFTLAVAAHGDLVDETPEYFGLALSDGDGLVIGDALVWVTIHDDDLAPRVTPGTAVVAEGDAGTTLLRLPVTLEETTSSRAIAVPWRTVVLGGLPYPEAVPGVDHTAASGTLTIPAGATEGWIEVEVAGDTVDDPDQLLVVSLSKPDAARIGGIWGLGFGGILDDD